MWVANVYWYLDEVSCVLVLRNKLWFNEAVKKLGETWSTIETERVTGCEHRAPKRRMKSDPDKLKEKLNNEKTETDKQKRKNSADKIKMSPQLTAIKNDQKINGKDGIPIIKVLTENLGDTKEITEDPDFIL